MEWEKIYRPERRTRMPWSDIATAIKSSVSMDDVLSVYAPATPKRGHRCPCPIHNGKDYNFSYTQNGYNCFVCGASGDVIAFVKEVCELATRADAMRRICEDFHLGYFDAVQAPEISEKVKKARAEADRRKAERDAWWGRYHELMDLFVKYQRTLDHGNPESKEYAEAARNIATIEYQLDSLPPEPR